MKYLIVIAFALFGVCMAREYDRPCRLAEMTPNVKSAFQVGFYLGPWYEIRRYEAQNQTDFDCVTAQYTLNADGSVQVLNSGYFNGQFISFTGRAVLTYPERDPLPAKLTVQFSPEQPTSIYWTLSTDYSNYAVVWSCRELPNGRSNESAWVLSRTPEVSLAVRNRYEEVLRQNNIVLEAMRTTNQQLAACRIGRSD